MGLGRVLAAVGVVLGDVSGMECCGGVWSWMARRGRKVVGLRGGAGAEGDGSGVGCGKLLAG